MLTPEADLEALLRATLPDPHRVLGMHPVTIGDRRRVIVRALVREALTCEVVDFTAQPELRYPLERRAPEGFFEGLIGDRTDVFTYRLRITLPNGEVRQFHDPYRFLPSISDYDLYLFNEGNHHRAYDVLGGHPRTLDGVPGFGFAVWAPSAKRVSLVGDFNGWDARYHPMRPMGSSGVWEIFVPGLSEGRKYKYAIAGADGYQHLKTDPYGARFEGPPYNSAITWQPGHYFWQDQEWMENRPKLSWREKPMLVYEVHAGSWRRVPEDGNRPLTYQELAQELVPYVKERGFTHIEFMPLAEHPYTGSWGYQVTGFMAPTFRYGSPEDFMALVDACHQAGLGVIIDWVPAHFPRDSFALAQFDGSHLYEHSDPRQGAHMDWGTLIFNYGRHEVRSFLIASALAWCEHFHIDGLRVDAVASMLYLDYSRKAGEWVPNKFGGRENLEAIDFLRQMNRVVHQSFPGVVTIAEESTSFPGVTTATDKGGLGFDLKWNMGWMHDTLLYFSKDPIYRRWHHHLLTFGMLYQNSESFIQVLSHDEVVHLKGSLIQKMPGGSITEKAAHLRAYLAMMWLWQGKKCLFMGGEFGQSAEWNYDGSLQWHLLQYAEHRGLLALVDDLNRLYRDYPWLAAGDFVPGAFEWVALGDHDQSVVSFLRKGKKEEETFLVVGHYSGSVVHNYRMGVPYAGYWKEVLNSAAKEYGGSGEGNWGGQATFDQSFDAHRQSLALTLPPNATLVFQYQGPAGK